MGGTGGDITRGKSKAAITHDGSWGKTMWGGVGGSLPLLMISGIIVEGRNYAARSWV